jgi:hypothetical protein
MVVMDRYEVIIKSYSYSSAMFVNLLLPMKATDAPQQMLRTHRSRCYGRTAALRLIVQPCDEDGQCFRFSCNGAPVE